MSRWFGDEPAGLRLDQREVVAPKRSLRRLTAASPPVELPATEDDLRAMSRHGGSMTVTGAERLTAMPSPS